MEDDAWDALPKYKEATIYTPRQPSYARRHLIHIIYISCAILSNLVTFEIISSLYGRGILTRMIQRTPQLMSKESFYAEIDKSYHLETLSGFSFNASKYTAPPSPEVDAEWEALGVSYEVFMIPKELSEAFHVKSTNLLISGDIMGGGRGTGYAANMEALHQLHCLNLLRKSLWFNHGYYASLAKTYPPEEIEKASFHTHAAAAFTDPFFGLSAHVNHCLDALRERIICAADTRVSLYQWDDDVGHTMPDFARPRQCKNFESVRTWAEERQVIFAGDYKAMVPGELSKEDNLH